MRTDTIGGLDVPGMPAIEDRHWRAAALAATATTTGPWDDGWRLNAPAVRRLRHGDEERSVPLRVSDDLPRAANGHDAIHVDVDGQSLEFHPAAPPTVDQAVRHATAHGSDGTAVLVAPMPGRVIAVRVAAGASVHAHQPVVVIEAMKMEHAVVSPIDGTLVSLSVSEGQQVQRGEVIGEVAQSDA
jgi:biotin carboxyl carrier protein